MRKRAFISLGLFLALLVAIFVLFSLEAPIGIAIGVIAIDVLGIVGCAVYPYIPPLWVNKVRQTGTQATAEVLPHEHYMKGVAGYQGGDHWLAVPVRVQSEDGTTFEAGMKCRLTQYIFGLIEAGSTVTVAYDPNKITRVVLVSEIDDLMHSRLRRE